MRFPNNYLLAALLLLTSALVPATASEADALALSRNIRARHMPHGTILDPIFAGATSDQIISYTRCGDSAIWTGHYLAAEAFRYRVTRAAEALANVRAALAGIKSLADVTGTNLLARCLVPLNSPYAQALTQEEARNGIYRNDAAGCYWIGNTSRDQYSGVFFGLGVAFDMVDDVSVRASITDLTTRLLDFLRGQGWSVVMPGGGVSTTFLGRSDQILSFLQVGRSVNPSRYDLTLDKALLSLTVPAPILLDAASDDSYFKFNLDHINLYNLIRLNSGSFGDVYAQAYRILHDHTKDHKNAFFNMIDRALQGPDAARDAGTLVMLDQWLARPRRDPTVDWRGQFQTCGNPGLSCTPLPVPLRVPTDFLWQRSPFQLQGGGSGIVESPGIDYLLPFWMARFYGLAASDSVVSAASGNTLVAAESIASFYGANLAGGAGVQVRDSAGATRTGQLFYLSPAQINFEIPAGTAVGQAAVTVVNAGGSPLRSTTAQVETVAPGLFTADGTGRGVAAALAIRVGVNGQQSVTPIFQCSVSACASIPINLGVDTPTYLSLFGTGLRYRSSLPSVTVTINGVGVPVQYAGPQGFYIGLDQVNVAVPLTLRGAGETDLLLTVDGQPANPVRVNIQ